MSLPYGGKRALARKGQRSANGIQRGLELLAMRSFHPLPVLLAFALSACASGVSPVPRLFESQAGPAVSRAHVVLRIAVPRKRSKHAHYISPATRSIAITALSSKGKTWRFNADLTPSKNRNCTMQFVCTISFALPAGRYRIALATYDGPLAGGNGFTNPPTGHELSANGAVPMDVMTGRNVFLRVVLGGIPARAAIVSYGTDGFTFSKCMASVAVGVFGVDADNNIIVGPGSPAVSLKSSDSAHLAVEHSPSPGSPNTFVLSRPQIPRRGSTVTLTATVTPVGGTGGTAVAAHTSATFNGDVCGTFTHYSIPTANSLPYLGIVAGADGAVWFAEHSGNNIGRITTTGSFTEYSAGPAGSYPTDLTTDASGLMWFTNHGTNNVGTITTGGTVTRYDQGTVGADGLFGVRIGSDGSTWWVAENSYQIGRLDVSGTSYTIHSTTTTTMNSDPVGLAAGTDGALWFTETAANKIGRITTDMLTKIEINVPTSDSGPWAITAGPDGALWFTEQSGNRIGRITTNGSISEFAIPTPVGNPYGIATGPDGALWFAECGANKIGRITTSGRITEFTITGTSNSQPLGITTGPDGNLWFTESGSNQIGRLQ